MSLRIEYVPPAPPLERSLTVSRGKTGWTWSAALLRRYSGVIERFEILVAAAGLCASRDEAWEMAREAGIGLAPGNITIVGGAS